MHGEDLSSSLPAARAKKVKAYKAKSDEYGALGQIPSDVCMLRYGVFSILGRCHIPSYRTRLFCRESQIVVSWKALDR